MHAIVIVLIGVVTVIAGVLVFRLHAFLALVLAAMIVGLLTPRRVLERYELERQSLPILYGHVVEIWLPSDAMARGGDRFQVVSAEGERLATLELVHVFWTAGDGSSAAEEGVFAARPVTALARVVDEQRRRSSAELLSGRVVPETVAASDDGESTGRIVADSLFIVRAGGGDGLLVGSPVYAVAGADRAEVAGVLQVRHRFLLERPAGAVQAWAIGHAEDGTSQWPADVLLVPPAAWESARRSASQTVGERVAAAFGRTCTSIGILIAMAAIIGKCLLDSGAADRIVRSAIRVVGERGAAVALVASGFLLGIPVFFDTVFYLMIPLGKALRLRTGRNYLLYVLSIVAGATMAHSLVPPTPGPLFVAEQLRVDLGLMIVAGTLVGLCSSMAGYCFARAMNRRLELPLRESPDFSLAEIQQIARRDDRSLPPLWLSVLPILLPVVLIAGNTVVESFRLIPQASPALPVLETLGNKNVALVLATAIAIGLLAWQRRARLAELSSAVQAALASGGVIILITAGGGAFGGALQQTGVASLIRQLPSVSPLVLLVLAFLITTAIRTAQGSATVAMITAVGVLGALVEGGQLACHPVYLALAIGCGSKPVAWMNDSGFWVICKMSGMTETEGLRLVTPMSILMGVVGLVVTLVAAAVFPGVPRM